jgi:hypothetical protein
MDVMYAARLICSDEACAAEAEVVAATLAEVEAECCPACGAGMQVLGVSFEASATGAVLRMLSHERERLEREPARLAA